LKSAAQTPPSQGFIPVLYNQTLEIRRRASLAEEKKYAEAEPLLLGGHQGMLARK
jgi:hypothetical protein